MEQTTTSNPKLTLWERIDRAADDIFIWPAVSILLLFSIFPLIVSLYLSFARINFVRGGVEVEWVGWLNYKRLLTGTQQDRFLGVFDSFSSSGWILFGFVALGLLYFLIAYLRTPGRTSGGFILRAALAAVLLGLMVLIAATMFSSEGRPGTLPVTLFYTYAGIIIQYAIGLGLALITGQSLWGRRFFRVVYLLPMMITPVGVAYMIRMMADTSKGPFAPLWQAAGLTDFSWVTSPWGARWVILIGDTWQWTPFMFIVLLAAVEGQSNEPIEAAKVDGASNWDIFRHITIPAILPVSTALILIRMIEAFKLVDLPRVMTGGGPGTATESVTMHAYSAWTARDYGGSAAIAYMLLVLVTIVSIAFVNLIRQRTTQAV
ncbi:sugar ABC transporter permease [Chloroflexi bacterium TSY]|nr:sugar ABC transporter permease [Chloroflexi bacterium TSY]